MKDSPIYIEKSVNDNCALSDANMQLNNKMEQIFKELQEAVECDIALARIAIDRDMTREKIKFLRMFKDFIRYISDYDMTVGEE